MTTSKGARTPKGAEPARAERNREGTRPSSPEHGARILFVSAGLSPRGGGIAAAGRLLLAATREWAAERRLALRVVTLGETDELPAGVDGEAFGGNQGALARAVWRAQLFEGYRHHVYDFLGVARIQGVLPRAWRARYLLYLYGIECWRPLRGSRRRALLGAADRLACSGHTAARLRETTPDAPAVTPLHLALGERTAGGEPDEHLIGSLGDRTILIVGRLAPGERYKGHDELLAATARLASRYPDVQLAIAGDGEDRPRLETAARALGIAGRVRFAGFVGEATLDALYRRCAVFAMPSKDEGFGFVYLEAMRAGTPCVALAGSAAAEIVADGVTGRLVEPGIDPLAAALAELLADPGRAAAMGAAGRERWQRHFHAKSFGSRLSPHLDALVSLAMDSGSAPASTDAAPTAPAGVRAGLAPARSVVAEP